MRHLLVAVAMVLAALLITTTISSVLQSRAVAHHIEEYTPPSFKAGAMNRPAAREIASGGAASGSVLSDPRQPRQRPQPRKAHAAPGEDEHA